MSSPVISRNGCKKTALGRSSIGAKGPQRNCRAHLTVNTLETCDFDCCSLAQLNRIELVVPAFCVVTSMSAATLNPQDLKKGSTSSKNSIDEDTEHSQSGPAYLSGALYAGGCGNNKNMLVNTNSMAPPATKSTVNQATTAIMDMKLSSLEDQEKASWEKHDSIHSRTSTVASSIRQGGDDHTNTVFDDSAIFDSSCSSFASFGGSENDEASDSILGLEVVGSNKRSLLDSKDKREAL